ncbi:MAG TPA: transcription antitermination factor NusB [Candidatus Alectryocaccomicrobium excrementavium]|uniref:Transcription antitermination protein NusB n=1 Tax=Candidatus Alectryocaccomicrobium excrementavium TaxID=2840668 RepID=A0A9D1K580_9FIRM|nr:transcription antitermination factor NusB [Candidatus Alectryocaccomicrobium excrementavium]
MDRTAARAAAMKLVFEWEMGGNGGDDTIFGLLEVPREDEEVGYIDEVVEGVKARQAEIDGWIAQFARGWSLDRMNRVDLAILRVAVFEILAGEVPGPVAVNEAVELSKLYSTERSAAFINGVLGSIRRARQ